jgi:hypothetical protein
MTRRSRPFARLANVVQESRGPSGRRSGDQILSGSTVPIGVLAGAVSGLITATPRMLCLVMHPVDQKSPCQKNIHNNPCHATTFVVGAEGLEPPTFAL